LVINTASEHAAAYRSLQYSSFLGLVSGAVTDKVDNILFFPSD